MPNTNPRFIVLGAVLAVGLAACGQQAQRDRAPTNQNPFTPEGFSTDHLAVERFTSFEPCDRTEEVSAPTARKFIKNLFARLAAGNTAFSGFNSIDRLCFVIGTGSDGNASANSITGAVRVDQTVLDQYEDVEILGMLAHEAAHLLMRHAEIGPLPNPLLSKDDGYMQVWGRAAKAQKLIQLSWKRRFAEAESRLRDLGKVDLAHRARNRATSSHNLAVELSRRIDDESLQAEVYTTNATEPEGAWLPETLLELNDPILTSMFGASLAHATPPEHQTALSALQQYEQDALPDSKFSSWKEEQADAIGLELFVNAGMSIDQYASVFEQMLRRMAEGGSHLLETCRQMIDSSTEPPKFGALSSKSHPTACWRLYNVERRLRPELEHRLPEVVGRPASVLTTNPSLDEARAELNP